MAAYLVPANLLGADEIIILAIKPSNWFVLLASLPVTAAAAVVAAGAFVVNLHHAPTPLRMIAYACAAAAADGAFAYRWEKSARAGGRLCIDPFEIDARGRVRAAETLGP